MDTALIDYDDFDIAAAWRELAVLYPAPAWETTHRDTIRETNRVSQRKYRRTHRNVVNSNKAKRRAMKRALPSDYTETDVDFATNYFHGCCAVCRNQAVGFYTRLHLDHWIPISSDNCPGTIPQNMVPLCSDCNLSKHDKQPHLWLRDKYTPHKAAVIERRIAAFFAEARHA